MIVLHQALIKANYANSSIREVIFKLSKNIIVLILVPNKGIRLEHLEILKTFFYARKIDLLCF